VIALELQIIEFNFYSLSI